MLMYMTNYPAGTLRKRHADHSNILLKEAQLSGKKRAEKMVATEAGSQTRHESARALSRASLKVTTPDKAPMCSQFFV